MRCCDQYVLRGCSTILNTRLALPANPRVRRRLIVAAMLIVGWLLSSLAVAYALTRRHGPRTAEDGTKNRRLEARESPPQDELMARSSVHGLSRGTTTVRAR